jgi:hypothetical protein
MKHDAHTRRRNIIPIVLVGLLLPTFLVPINIDAVLVLVFAVVIFVESIIFGVSRIDPSYRLDIALCRA